MEIAVVLLHHQRLQLTHKYGNPSFSAQPSSPSTDTTPTWSWNAVSGASHYAYRLSSNNGSSYGSWSSWTTSRTYTPTLSTDSIYKLQIRCKDLAGNQSSATTSNSYTLDTTAPSAPIFSTQPSSPDNDTTPTRLECGKWSISLFV